MDQEILRQKADIKDLIKLGEIKSNKFDTEFLQKCADVQHDQIQHIIVLLLEILKTLVH